MSQEEFIKLVLKYHAAGMDADLTARQIVDDHFIATGRSLHMSQHIVEHLVKETLKKENLL